VKEGKSADEIRLSGAVCANQNVDRPQWQLLNGGYALEALDRDEIERRG
jgi:hypothetical protein